MNHLMIAVLLIYTLILEVYNDVCDEPAPNIKNLTNHDSVIGSAVVSEEHT